MSIDPFTDVEEDAWSQIRVLDSIILNADIITEELKLDFSNGFQELEEIITDLNEALNVSQANPQQFQLTVADIENRHGVLEKLEKKKRSLSSIWKEKTNDSKRSRPVTAMSNRISQDGSNPFTDQHKIDGEFEQFQQQEMIRDQDLQLDTIHETMRNLNQQAMIMGSELEDQGMMLDELDTNLDRVDNRLQRGLKRVNWIIEKNKERGSDWCIGILVVALVVLLILLIAV
ncbi:hypothetical protein PSN45_003039 [Yamadazyma tenuis]|uniref:t-SNARE affecting a late Golgi compartment protein 1 n=1 Tax=Candida tenuis (strain ATCC 10573 / BCRC 21748 / CBS 615 / JCM 9827 / NBRC 10315 / NRRL Y-1498 / VKM Y-70) TaxID=590646 RepID=G3AXE3_CANTC|nr:uncharacterized protein CANTEDRAFT_112103 [Yamadazyma tenuis ATCC 10573]EGV66353.1 hypothetical protein CANTEDRAFT_112103 [Yamadazyma tenuis ATCC 10573]WEJ95519.1 hypothetical protein PSN45_003039 [Yamadazyma tenuis]